MIYFDNSATTYPKPLQVREAMRTALEKYGANPGRGGYKMSEEAAMQVYSVRKKLAKTFNAPSEENVIFTSNCTQSLNMAIKGLASGQGHAVTSCLEHNAVIRPLQKLKETSFFNYTMVNVSNDFDETARRFLNQVRKDTKFIVCTSACNVFGDVLPIEKIGKIAKEVDIPLIVDAAQSAGTFDIDMKRDNISCLCMPGHKGLYGPMGTGVLILNDDIELDTIIEGGTGSDSKNFRQPDFLPDRFESGTLNVCGIIALGKGVDFVNNKGISNIHDYESSLIEMLFENLKENKNVQLYQNYDRKRYAPILAMNFKNHSGEETAEKLSEYSIAVRGGFHCNSCAHEFYKTNKTGVARISVSCFNTKHEIKYFINSVNKIAKML